MSLRERFGWNSFFEQQITAIARPDLQFARIVEEQRGLYRIAGDADGWVEVSGRFRHDAINAAAFPSVGDWVGVRDGIVHVRLDRRSTVSRAAAGRAVEEQVVAANVDVIFSGDRALRRSQHAASGALSDDGVGCWRAPGSGAEQGGSLRRPDSPPRSPCARGCR